MDNQPKKINIPRWVPVQLIEIHEQNLMSK